MKTTDEIKKWAETELAGQYKEWRKTLEEFDFNPDEEIHEDIADFPGADVFRGYITALENLLVFLKE